MLIYASKPLIHIDLQLDSTTENPRVGSSILSLATIFSFNKSIIYKLLAYSSVRSGFDLAL